MVTKWSNTIKQFVGSFPTSYLSVFDHFVGLVLIGLRKRLQSENIYKGDCYNCNNLGSSPNFKFRKLETQFGDDPLYLFTTDFFTCKVY